MYPISFPKPFITIPLLGARHESCLIVGGPTGDLPKTLPKIYCLQGWKYGISLRFVHRALEVSP